MKFDQKTGKKQPESRIDEIQIGFDEIKKMFDDTKGMIDPQIEQGIMLRDINVSLALVVDLLSAIFNQLKSGGKADG